MKFPTLIVVITSSILTSVSITPGIADGQESTASDVPRAAFSVMTWNLEWFFDDSKQENYSPLSQEKSAPSRGDWNWRRDAAANVIAQTQPSVVAVQEVEGQRVLWYLSQALDRQHQLKYDEYLIQGNDHFTEQDVGFLVESNTEMVSSIRGNVTPRMKKAGRFGSVSKHVAAVIDVPVGDQTESILIVNVHLRSGESGAAIRAKQAASLNEWIRRWSANHQIDHLIVLGDFNTEESAGQINLGSELAVFQSRSTESSDDDLVDLHDHIRLGDRQTHLLTGKQFDRILVSPSLIIDEPGVLDLTLGNVSVRRDLVVQGDVDTPVEHWEQFWQMPESERDLSDHYPVMAEFVIQ
ncbi:endonuclease/exonuclease/phosphatase family protein [Neorhodopirellula pilleata]|uniref:Endonuclease/Exonuclease/phosphatase family protein n=1 Tax=Neorhodopirellula pilleata TaxID=2714738 RepID=A0A5C6AV13_9BACT|nr:endonuclease/exonuclease/phosphatase family protein [Neorhodopirellula pilleata]TWU03570.1 Endonuclease/Exonuclease/phosphatase family protein [Neorhodopirellula pilleata]